MANNEKVRGGNSAYATKMSSRHRERCRLHCCQGLLILCLPVFVAAQVPATSPSAPPSRSTPSPSRKLPRTSTSPNDDVRSAAVPANIEKDNPPTSDLIQLHIAEYNSLTTRNTYMITLQYSLLPVFLGYITIVFSLSRRTSQCVVVWGGFIGAVLLGIFWAQVLWEQYNNLLYIESRLRPMAAALARSGKFWCYESYLAQRRGTGWLWTEWLAAITDPIVLVVLVVLRAVVIHKQRQAEGTVRLGHGRHEIRVSRPPLTWRAVRGDVLGIVLSVPLLIRLVRVISEAVELRSRINSNACF